ncbi:cell wall integrity and stress response component 4 [Hypomesus transpacificus]|uniref:cell wall integrity and stress response component 4 n=1 Tax=Hypomesus transpacificus TaxID=137520 RepID=UPI001F073E1F|nr:cell wall integrity and stress response component 4 [Hypomesus transpacificus]
MDGWTLLSFLMPLLQLNIYGAALDSSTPAVIPDTSTASTQSTTTATSTSAPSLPSTTSSAPPSIPAASSSTTSSSTQGGCASPSVLCCTGQDNSCTRVDSDTNRQCFCDEGCQVNQDCCLDYQGICKESYSTSTASPRDGSTHTDPKDTRPLVVFLTFSVLSGENSEEAIVNALQNFLSQTQAHTQGKQTNAILNMRIRRIRKI